MPKQHTYFSATLFFLIVFLIVPPVFAGAKQTFSTEKIFPDTLTLEYNRYKIAPFVRPARKSIGLALSGGGARGLAQVGVLKALEENQIPIDFIVGTSIGAIVGGLYSVGYSASELEAICLTLPWEELTSLANAAHRRDLFLEQKKVRDRATVTLRFDGLQLMIPKSFSAAQPLTKTLDLLILNAPYHSNHEFNQLPIPFRAVAADLITGTRVVLKAGSISEAMRASATVPLIFSPIKSGKYELVDGGLVSNLPVDLIEKYDYDLKVAVNTMGVLYHSPQDLDLPWKTADQIIGIMMLDQNRKQLQQADVVISPQLGSHESANFSAVDTLIQLGYSAGLQLADSLKKITASPSASTVSARGYEKKLLGIDAFPDSLQQLIREHVFAEPHIKSGLTQLLDTDLFTDAYAEIDHEQNLLTYVAKPLHVFHHVKISGLALFSDEKVQSVFSPILGKNYTNREGTLQLERLVHEYRNRGFPLVDLAKVHVRQDTLFIETSSGKVSDINIFRSRKRTQKSIIDREITFDTSKVLSKSSVEKSISQLYNTSIFNRVSMFPVDYHDSTGALLTEMNIKLDERYSEILRFGFRVDDVYGSQFLLDFRNENFLGRATEFGGWTTIGSRNYSGQIEFRAHRLWSTYLTFFTRVFYEHRDVYKTLVFFSHAGVSSDRDRLGEYGHQSYGTAIAIGGQVHRDGLASLELIFQNAQTFPGTFNIDRENLDLLTLRTRLTLDTRDDPTGAKKGNYLDIYYEHTPQFGDRNDAFSKLFLSYQDIGRITDDIAVRVNLNFGIADDLTPLSQQFSLGGISSSYSTTFYGFRLDDYRGRQLLTSGIDLHFDIPLLLVFPTSFCLHYNIGNIWEQAEEKMKIEDFFHGVGATFSVHTPIGPARLSVAKAFRLDPEKNSRTMQFAPTVFYFVLGYEF
ncbi:Patatin [Chloroherpeton thalassium ATCC 35110]|uniref:Patatin n=1 Tax=Chloroherpeton thalassium (strain ATCC 35110 / GB-78) TaxID=517418 RepID=B3QRT4_CHLT3|nr:patatin-like phospholipase family protein [Chloroherpeton thalassium]ACF13887.1 Patatin [Chloroherpeton thalassium ATCC 35110]